MDNGRMIKLLLPTNKFIKIQISGDENELKDLLSTVIDSTPSQIKGIKDSEGNYYTLSSAIRSANLLQKNDNIYYELILGKPQQEKKLEIQKNMLNYYKDRNLRNNIILNTSPKVGNYYANYFISGNNNPSNLNNNTLNNNLNNIFKKRGLSFDEIREISQQEIQLFSAYLFQFLSLKLINDDMLFELNKMMSENNKELYHEFNLFKIGKITQENFIRCLNYFYNDKKKEKEREKNVLSSSQKSKKVIKGLTDIEDENEYRDKIYEKMKEYFEGENLNIVRLTLKYENESIMIAIKKFKEDANLIDLIESFQKAIKRFKRKTIQNQKYTLSLNPIIYKPIVQKTFEKYTRREERHHSSPQGTVESDLNKHKKRLEKKIEENEKIKIYQKKNSSKKISKSIEKNLTHNNKYLFEFIVKNNRSEYLSFRNIYNQKNKIDNLNKVLNDHCQQIIDKEIINYGEKNNIQISNYSIDLLHKLVSKSLSSINTIFEKLLKHNSMEIFCQDLITLINNLKHSSNNIRNDIKKCKIMQLNNIIEDFNNDLHKINIKGKDKDKINTLINSKNPKIIKLINEYKKTKNINLYEKEIKDILKLKTTNIFSNLKIKDKPKKIFSNKIVNERYNLSKKNTSTDKDSSRLEPKFSDITMTLIQEDPLSSFENTLFQTKSFQDNEIFFLKKKFSEKNSMLLSIFDCYKNEKDINEFKESINMFLKKENKKEVLNIYQVKNDKNSNLQFSFFSKEAKNESKEKLNWIINNDNKINNVLDKQKEIISLLYKEYCIDQNTYDIINDSIEKNDKGLISAFEVYAITKDHSEFIETLQLFSELKESYKRSFYNLINSSSFNMNQKEKLNSLYLERNKSLFDILKAFENNENKENAFLQMKNLLSKKN